MKTNIFPMENRELLLKRERERETKNGRKCRATHLFDLKTNFFHGLSSKFSLELERKAAVLILLFIDL